MNKTELARISKALSDPTRLCIYEAISTRQEMFCGELVEKHRLTPGTVSHHLKILADAKLIECRRQGQFIYNQSRPKTIRDYSLALTRMASPARRKQR